MLMIKTRIMHTLSNFQKHLTLVVIKGTAAAYLTEQTTASNLIHNFTIPVCFKYKSKTHWMY